MMEAVYSLESQFFEGNVHFKAAASDPGLKKKKKKI